jgi:hypothetical protein
MDLFGQTTPIDLQAALSKNIEYGRIRRQLELKLRRDIDNELREHGFTRELQRCLERTYFYINKFPSFRGYKPSLTTTEFGLDVIQFRQACLDWIRRIEVFKRHYIRFDNELRATMRQYTRMEDIDAFSRTRIWIKANPYVYSRSSIFELPPKEYKVGKTALYLSDVLHARILLQQHMYSTDVALQTYGYLQ